MLFVEYRFLVFFVAVFGVCWALRSNAARKVWLLLTSYGFYAGWDWRFLGLIWASTLVDYVVGLRLGSARTVHRRSWLLLSLVANLGLLGFFKYANFFVDSLGVFLDTLGVPFDHGTLNIILPVGISFYTFQTLSYSIDVYRGVLPARRNMLDVALFVAFFPQLVAGPIVRAKSFLPQLRTARRFSTVDIRGCLVLFLVGFIKKACVSDNLAPVADAYFAAPQSYDALSAWAGVLAYAAQIYCDFSGYSDMAIACAGLLGYRLLLNFDFPYFARNITDFWRRWHISLSSWLRDYLYIPLGGNRGSKLFTYRNLMLTMLLGGLWHGAAWTFVVWGGLHGVALIVHREIFRLRGVPARVAMGFARLGPVLTFYWVCVAWIFFRARSFGDAVDALQGFVLLRSTGARELGITPLAVLVVLAVVHGISCRWLRRAGREVEPRSVLRRAPMPLFALGYGVAVAVALALVPASSKPFIYFQF